MTQNQASFKEMFISENLDQSVKEKKESKTVFSKLTHEILKKYNNKNSGRFKTFNKDLAYLMMTNDQYLFRVSEKSVSLIKVYLTVNFIIL